MKNLFYFLLFISLAAVTTSAQTVGDVSTETMKIEAKPAGGFA